jgi:hypothetical protein
MKLTKFLFCSFFLIISCTADGVGEGAFSGSDSAADTSGDSGQGNSGDTSPGQITAGEWNDLDTWSFWLDIVNNETYSQTETYWGFFTKNRLVFEVKDAIGSPINGVLVTLFRNGVYVTETKTDNFGKTNIFIDLNQNTENLIDYSLYAYSINSESATTAVVPFFEGVNQIQIENMNTIDNKIELSFIVDATGSMGDELEFLKNDLQDVISRVQTENQDSQILTSSVFYRDHGDDYVVKHSDFTSNTDTTLQFIEEQFADGGGDFPEAVDAAISKSINTLQWSSNAKTKIAFLLLDAPPHHESQIISDMHQTIVNAAAQGIKIIPITASGIDKQTEFLMRYFAISTNSTYVFITDDSGIGNDHLEPTVGDFQVEFLNDLMVRLINKYAQ